jgi:hypothetical protein
MAIKNHISTKSKLEMKSIVYKKYLRMMEIFESLPEKTMELAKQADTSFCLSLELSTDRNNKLIVSLNNINGISVKEISAIESNYKKNIRNLLRNKKFLFRMGRVSITRTIKDKQLTIEYEFQIGYRNTNNRILWVKKPPHNIFYCFFAT